MNPIDGRKQKTKQTWSIFFQTKLEKKFNTSTECNV